MQRNLVRFTLILILALTVVVPAMAQVEFRVSSVPRNARGEGRTETAGEVTLVVVRAGTIRGGSSVIATFDGRITNSPTAAGNVTCSLAGAVPSAAQCTTAPASADPGAAGGMGLGLTFSGRRLTIGFSADRHFALNDLINMFGVRIDVAGVGAGITFVNVVMSGASSFPGTNPVTFTDDTRRVINVIRPSIGVGMPTAVGTSTPIILPPALLTCAPAVINFAVGIQETFEQAFTSRAQERTFSTTPLAAERLRLRIRVFGLPAGFTITPVSTVGSTPSLVFRALPGAVAQTTSGERRDFDITFEDVGIASPGADGIFGTADDVLINGPRLDAIEVAVINFRIAHTDGLAVASGGLTGPITAEVQLRPIEDPIAPPDQTILSFADNRLPEPRATVANITDCLTTLLFPYAASSVGGFDTGIAIANTSNDDAALGAVGSATATEGPCTLTGYKAADGATVTFTTPTIKAGASYINLLSALSTFGGATGGFQGYVFGVCRFLHAHAFTFIFDGTGLPAPRLAEGYLALIVPQPRGPVPCAAPPLGTCGEALGH